MAGIALALLDRLASGLKLDLPASAAEARKGGASDPKGAGNKKIVSFLVRLIDIAAKRAKHFGFDELGKLRVGFDPGARNVLGHGTPQADVRLAMSNPGRSGTVYAATG